MDGSLVIMAGSLLSRFLLLQWMESLSLWMVVYHVIFVSPMDGSLVIMEGSLLFIFLILQWMVALSLRKVVYCRYFFYSNGWQPCHYGRQSVVEIFVTPMDGRLVIMAGSLLSISLLLQWMVAFSLWKVVCCRDLGNSNGWQPCL